MGDDTALPPLAGRARPLYSYFRQRFAQVTNPPIDHLRERHIVLAAHASSAAARRCSTRGPESARGTELESFFLYPDALDELGADRARRDLRVGHARARASRLADEAEAARPRGPHDAAALRHGGDRSVRSRCCSRSGPSTTASSRRGLRTLATIVVETDEAARGAPPRLPARLRRGGDLPAARARDGRGARRGRQGRRRPSRRRTRRSAASARRSRTAC